MMVRERDQARRRVMAGAQERMRVWVGVIAGEGEGEGEIKETVRAMESEGEASMKE